MHGTDLDWKIGVVIFTAVVIIYSILILILTQ
jgi:hypothetical protein